ncbi:MAG: hypothetical protein HRU29_03155 [Rhizobiales bacterium]|nr:hypothetical protein [Hyphomicrobiales bacterium]NRB13376.1 hypothetical protein [Hyphomicrobiales bacterium]
MQIFFWVSITILATASFVYLTMPILAKLPIIQTTTTAVSLPTNSKLLLFLFSGLLIFGSIGIYAYIGAPSTFQAKQTPLIDEKIQRIIAEIETHLTDNPEDADGWQVVAPTYLSLNQPQKAFAAFANAIKFGNSNGSNWLGLGKADLQINRGVFGDMSAVAFGKAHEKMPDNVEAMFYYASMLQNMGDTAQAKTEVEEFIAVHNLDAEQVAPLNNILTSIMQQEAN